MQNVRIIEIPAMKAVYSGPLTSEEKFESFNRWFSRYHASLAGELYPRDFMWYNERLGAQEWLYALPRDADLDEAADWMKTREELMQWVESSGRFRLYRNGEGKPERYPMFHIVSPGRLIPRGISIEDLYMPIEEIGSE